MIVILLSLLVILHAYIDAKRIKRNWKIRHGEEGIYYAIAVGYIWYINHFITGLEWYWGVSLGITARMAWFDNCLNVFRGKNILYQGSTIKGLDVKKSIIDQIENKLGINILWLRIFYVILFLANIALYLIF